MVIGWPWCGTCRNCLAGKQRYCAELGPLVAAGGRPDGTPALRRPDGTPVHSHFFGQSSFATHSMTWERSVVKVADDAPIELLGPLACGLSTGAGAVFNALSPMPARASPSSAPAPSGWPRCWRRAERGCTRIVGVDRVPERLSLATAFGAADTIDASARPTPSAPSAS